MAVEICLGGPVSNWFPTFGDYWQNFGIPNLQKPTLPPSFSPVFAIPLPELPTWCKVGHEQPDADLVEWFATFFGNLYLNILGFFVGIFADLGIPFPWIEIPIGSETISLEVIFNGGLCGELSKPNILEALNGLFLEFSEFVKSGKDAFKKLIMLMMDTISKMLNLLVNIPQLIIGLVPGGDAFKPIKEAMQAFLDGIQFPTIPTLDDILIYMKSANLPLTCEGLNDALGAVGLGFNLGTFGIPCPIGGAVVGSFDFLTALTTFMANIGSLVLKVFTEIYIEFQSLAGFLGLPELEIPEFCITLGDPVQINTPFEPIV